MLKCFFWGLLITLVCAAVLSGVEPGFQGSWFSDDTGDTFILSGGNWEVWYGGELVVKGTYTVRGNRIVMVTRYRHSSEIWGWLWWTRFELEQRLYSRAELETIARSIILDEWDIAELNENLEELFGLPLEARYSVSGNTLTFEVYEPWEDEEWGESYTFTRR